MSYLLNNRKYNNLQLFTRNEGKIKSYESCSDVRAWSHDVCKRSRYLREWIKCDMPLCVVPVATLLGFFRTMTCKKVGKAVPRCHPDCKSKVILDSIISTCDAIRDCLKVDESLEKYFIEEELETGHWPCERCLEVLKSIKLFWKILLERVYAINLTKTECDDSCSNVDSVRDMARVWQKDMIQQAMFVKCISAELLAEKKSSSKKVCIRAVNTCRNLSAPCSEGDARNLSRKCSLTSCVSKHTCSQKRVKLDCSSSIVLPKSNAPRRCKSTTARISCVDVACEPHCGDEVKLDIPCLQRSFNLQKKEIEQLKKENATLKCQLQNMYKCCKRKPPFYSQCPPEKDCAALVPIPFECCIEDSCSSSVSNAKDADSELIITMKNCKHKSFRHVSLLQVLHKTNDPCLCPDTNLDGPCFKDEDPVKLLTKVQTTLGAMVKKEMTLANCKKKCGSSNSNSEIEASFRRVKVCKSAPSSNCTLG